MKLSEATKIYMKFDDEIRKAPCSAKHHLNIKGGLLKHLNNVAMVARKLDPENETLIALAWIHDLGKCRTYTFDERGNPIYAKPSVDHLLNTIAMIGECGVVLTQEELNALQYHHGGWSPFSNMGQSTELAVKLHYCDMIAMLEEDKT